MCKTILIILTCFVFSKTSIAQWNWDNIRHFTEADGFYEREFSGVAIDSKNIVWLASVSGMYIFDGNTLVPAQKIYPLLKAYFSLGIYQMIYVQDKNEIWYCTQTELFVLKLDLLGDKTNKTAVQSIYKAKKDEGMNGMAIMQHTLFFTCGKQLFYISLNDIYNTVNADKSNYSITSLQIDKNGEPYITTNISSDVYGIFKLNKTTAANKSGYEFKKLIAITKGQFWEIFYRFHDFVHTLVGEKYADYRAFLTDSLVKKLQVANGGFRVTDAAVQTGKWLWLATNYGFYAVPALRSYSSSSVFKDPCRSVFYDTRRKKLLYCTTKGIMQDINIGTDSARLGNTLTPDYYNAGLLWDDSTWMAFNQKNSTTMFIYNCNKGSNTTLPIDAPFVYSCQKVSNQLWTGSTLITVSEYRNKAFVQVKKVEISQASILGISPAVNGKVLVATVNGLYIIDIKSFEKKLVAPGFFYCAAATGNSWAAGSTADGLFLLDSLGNIARHVSVNEGMPHPTVYNMVYDERAKQLWCGTKQGLASYNMLSGLVKVFTSDDGLANDEFNNNSMYLSPDGILCAGGMKGVDILYVDTLKKARKELNISLFTAKGTAANLVYSSWNMPDVVELPVGSFDIKIYFSTINEKNNEYYRYRIKGDNYNSEWAYKEMHEPFEIIGMASGSYTIEFDTESSGNNISKPMQIKLFIADVWYHSRIVYTLEIIAGLVLLRFLFIWREKQRNKKAAMEKLIVQNELKALRAELNPGFIKSMFDFVINIVVTSSADHVVKVLRELSLYLRQVLDMSEHAQLTIEDELDHAERYLHTQRMIRPDLFTYAIDVADAVDTIGIYLPSMLIQPIVENTIKYGFADIKEGGMININVDQQGHTIILSIKDNGATLQNMRKADIGKAVTKQQEGIEITKKRMLINLKQHRAQKINIQYHDRTDEIAGTEFIIQFTIKP